MVSLALVLAILAAIGPVLELDAAGLQVMAPLIQQRLKERLAHKPPGRIRGASHYAPGIRGGSTAREGHLASPPICVQFRCSE